MKITEKNLRKLIREEILEANSKKCSICHRNIEGESKNVDIDGRKYIVCSNKCFQTLAKRPR